MRVILHLLITITLVSCGSIKTCEQYVTLQYEDFGPQAMAYPLIGMQWWQWLNHSDADPETKYTIKVIVHPEALTVQLKNDYPVYPEKNQDYRFISFVNASGYLNGHIAEDLIPTLTAKLKETRQKIDAVNSCTK